MMEMVVTTGLLGAISHAKLQSNHHQQTNTTLPVVHHDQHYVCYENSLYVICADNACVPGIL